MCGVSPVDAIVDPVVGSVGSENRTRARFFADCLRDGVLGDDACSTFPSGRAVLGASLTGEMTLLRRLPLRGGSEPWRSMSVFVLLVEVESVIVGVVVVVVGGDDLEFPSSQAV